MLMNKYTGAWELVLHPPGDPIAEGMEKMAEKDVTMAKASDSRHDINIPADRQCLSCCSSQHTETLLLSAPSLLWIKNFFCVLPVKCLPDYRCHFVGATQFLWIFFSPVELPLNYPPALFSKTSGAFEKCWPICLTALPAWRNPYISLSGAATHSLALFEWSPLTFQHHPDNALLSFDISIIPLSNKTNYIAHCI